MESQESRTFILHCFEEKQITKFQKNAKCPNFGPFFAQIWAKMNFPQHLGSLTF